MTDTFLLDVEFVVDDYDSKHYVTRVEVSASTSSEAELVALQIVASDGRKLVNVAIDWDNF